MENYGLSENDLTFLYSCQERWKQSVNINNVLIVFQILLSGSTLGPQLFNIFINGLFYF